LSSAAVYKLTFLRKIGEANAKTAIYKLSNEGAQRRSDAATTCYMLLLLKQMQPETGTLKLFN
jgi:hypothetical protein